MVTWPPDRSWWRGWSRVSVFRGVLEALNVEEVGKTKNQRKPEPRWGFFRGSRGQGPSVTLNFEGPTPPLLRRDDRRGNGRHLPHLLSD